MPPVSGVVVVYFPCDVTTQISCTEANNESSLNLNNPDVYCTLHIVVSTRNFRHRPCLTPLTVGTKISLEFKIKEWNLNIS